VNGDEITPGPCTVWLNGHGPFDAELEIVRRENLKKWRLSLASPVPHDLAWELATASLVDALVRRDRDYTGRCTVHVNHPTGAFSAQGSGPLVAVD